MSASSNCVTCGIITQLRARLAPEIFLIRDSGFASTGPNFAKSTFGHGSRLSEPPPVTPAPGAAGAPPPAITPLTNCCTSSCRMRPFGPVPVTRARSTPSSRANLRTDGDACAAVNAAASAGAAAGALRRLLPQGRPAAVQAAARPQWARTPARAQARRAGAGAVAAVGAGGGAVAGAFLLQRQHHRALAHLVAELDRISLHHARRRRRHVHRRLVRFQRDQRIVGLARCRRASRHLDHRNVLEVADVGHLDFDRAH